ncbi:MAG: DUF1552 domain-containing protein [Sandaracinaceae bacterium]
MTQTKLHRRTLLRGAAGAASAAVALPLLEAMMPSRARATNGFPNRFVTSFGGVTTGLALGSLPLPLGQMNGVLPSFFAGLEDVKRDVAIVSGLTIPQANDDASVPPGGRYNKNHIKQMSPLFTGVRSQLADHNVFRGKTADQIVADSVGAGTAFPTGFQFLIQPSGYQYGSSGRDALSARGPSNGITGRSNLDVVFGNLFGAPPPAPTPGAPTGSPDATLRRQGSVLDVLIGSAQRLSGRLGAADRRRIDQHLTELRAVETRIQALLAQASPPGTTPPPTTTSSSCATPSSLPVPGATTTFTSPDGQLVGWSYEDERASIMAELCALALACDLTRTATWHISWEQCGISARHVVGDDSAFHQLGHSGTGSQKQAVAAWHLEQFAKLVRAIRDKTEGGQSLLDSTFCAFFFGESPSSHGYRDAPAVVAGCPHALRMGEHVRIADEHPAKVLISGMQAVGLGTNTLGEVSGNHGALTR